ncbi:hypothetical protein [Tianweitania sediminis]|uniref:Uncharacterized protein n=1 Tax=Tianweitania sediminis TaxID=1502156 RepID=A0A8J7UK24_9HYPH|nr:hypothetical protein [Tianweitania sediminis]MBP0440673.1 hypothetical protein [Tianweitania sediminis]
MKLQTAFALVDKRGIDLGSVFEKEREVRVYADRTDPQWKAKGYTIRKVHITVVDDGVWQE